MAGSLNNEWICRGGGGEGEHERGGKGSGLVPGIFLEIISVGFQEEMTSRVDWGGGVRVNS